MEANTVGQSKLQETGLGVREMARRLGCSAPSVHRYMTGERVPDQDVRARVEEMFGIPSDDWDVSVGGNVIRQRTSAVTRGRRDSVSPPLPGLKVDLGSAPESDDLRVQMRYHLDQVRAMRIGATEEGKFDFVLKLLAQEEKAMMDLAKFTRELTPADESRLCETSAWIDLRARLVRALMPYPEAARAVMEALGE